MKNFATFLSVLFFATSSHADDNGEFTIEYPTVKSTFNLEQDIDLMNVLLICGILFRYAEQPEMEEYAKNFASAFSKYQIFNKPLTTKEPDEKRINAFESEITTLLSTTGYNINKRILLNHCGIVDEKTRSLFE